MATTTAQASGTTTPDDWTLAAGASKTAAVALPDNETTSYIQSGATPGTYQTFTFAPDLSVGDTITEVVVYARCKRGGASDCTFRVGYAFTPNGGGSQTNEVGIGVLEATVNYADFSFTDSGLSVVWGSNFTAWIRNTQARQLHCTTFYIGLTYTPAGGGGVPVKAYYYARLRG